MARIFRDEMKSFAGVVRSLLDTQPADWPRDALYALANLAPVSIWKREQLSMERAPLGKPPKGAASSPSPKVEAALASRDEVTQLRSKLLKMIVDNEQKRRSDKVTTPV